MTVSRLIARPMLATMFITGGINALRNASSLAPAAEPVADKVVPEVKKRAPQVPLPEDPVNQVRLNGAVQVVAGLALATGKAPRLSALALAGTLVPTTLAGHAFWQESDKDARADQQVHFFKNVSMLGGLLIAAGDTEGKPGVAWRAKRAAKDARREAGQLGRSARREAKIAAAQVS